MSASSIAFVFAFGCFFVGVVGSVQILMKRRRPESAILPAGFRFYEYPTDGEPPGTVKRLNLKTNVRFQEGLLPLTESDIAESELQVGKHEGQFTIESALDAGLQLVKVSVDGDAKAAKKVKVTLDAAGCKIETVPGGQLDKLLSEFCKSRFQSKSADSKDTYFVIRECLKANELVISVKEEEVKRYGVKIEAGTADAQGDIWKENDKGIHKIHYKGQKPFRYAYKDEEICVDGKDKLTRFWGWVCRKEVLVGGLLVGGVISAALGAYLTITPPPPYAPPTPVPGMVEIPGDSGSKAFWIDRTEVTNAAFKEYVDKLEDPETQAEKPGARSWVLNEQDSGSDAVWVERKSATWKQPFGPDKNIKGLGQDPVVHVTWAEAAAYCGSIGKRLPSKDEWERAAGSGMYPWGDDAVAGDKANFSDDSMTGFNMMPQIPGLDDTSRTTAPVDSYRAGASPYGVLNMAGNVWEWVEGKDKDCRLNLAKGGSWTEGEKNLRVAESSCKSPSETRVDLGFRCAKAK